MEKRTILLTILLLVNICLSSFGQFKYPSKKNMDILADKTLAVELLEGENNESLNNALIQSFDDKWTFTNVEFFKSSEISQLLKDKNEDYVYLFQGNANKEDIRTRKTYTHSNGRKADNSFGKIIESKQDYLAFSFQYYAFKLLNINEGKAKTITRITFANSELSKIDYIFLVQQLDRLVTYAYNGETANDYYGDIEKNIEKIKSSKLILLNDFFKEKDLNKMSKFLDIPYELVDYESYENTIINQEKGTTHIKIIWNDFQGLYVWIVVDSESGKILAQTSFGGIKFGKYHTANEIIKPKHLKYMTNRTAQKFNSRHYR